MRRHIPFKASIRQPVRTLIFVLLVGLASFGFVSRAVEYIILNREMNRIEEFYRTVGTLIPQDPIINNNVYQAAEIIRNSPYVEFEDRRTITQGTMDGILNSIHGQQTIGGNAHVRGEQMFSYKGLYIFDTIAIVRADRISNSRVTDQATGEMSMGRALTISIIDALYGHNPFMATRQYMALFAIDENDAAQIDDLQQGGYYLVRIVQQSDHPTNTAVDFFPLFDDVYFVNANDDVAMENAFTAMADNLVLLEANTTMLMLTGTKDMTALPFVQSGVYTRFQGRLINHEDYLNANHVMVIPQRMDSTRRYARVGETVTLTLRDMRTFLDGAPLPPEDHPLHWMIPSGAEAHWANIPAGYWVSIPQAYEGDWQNYPTITIEVEVVGSYVVPAMWNLPRWAHITDSFRNMEVFVPASIIPEGFGIVDAHIVSGAYSFVLSSPDADVPFMAAHGSQLAELGFTVQFMGEDPTNFLLSAVPIRNSIRINLALFSAVLGIVLVLTVFLFLRQRYKEFAILRALGISESKAIWQVFVPVLLFWVPITIAASIGAWYFALNQASTSLQILAEIGIPTDYGQVEVVVNFLDRMRFDAEQEILRTIPQLSMVYLVWLCAGLLLAWLGTVLVGTISFAGKSMISLIQGVNSGGAPVRYIKETAPPANVKMANVNEILQMAPVLSVFGKVKSSLRHHRRHIFRSPVKSLLVVGMALLFIIALGWLDRTIDFTEREIDRLYDTTVITGQIINPGAGLDGAMWGHGIPDNSLRILLESGFADDLYLTALSRIGLFAPFDDGGNYRNIREIRHVPANEIIKSYTSWDTFMYDINRPAAFGIALSGDFEIEFAPGFGPEDFMLEIDWEEFLTWLEPDYEDDDEEDVDDSEEDEYVVFRVELDGIIIIEGEEPPEVVPVEIQPIPIIVHESLLYRPFMLYSGMREDWFMEYGAMTQHWVGANTVRYMLDEDGFRIWHKLNLGDRAYLSPEWQGSMATPVIIAGIYRGGHPGVGYRMGHGLIFAPNLRWTHWSTAEFTIRQEYIRNYHEFVDKLNELLTYHIHHQWWNNWAGRYDTFTETFTHVIELNDAEFRTVVVPLEENLNLLRILYPVAKVMSFVLAMGLSLLLMLQNAKIVAILRVLGSARYKTRLNLGMEQLIVCIIGVAIGFAAVMFMGIGVATAGMLVGIYLAGAAAGTVVGVLVISYKTPLELLQVRE